MSVLKDRTNLCGCSSGVTAARCCALQIGQLGAADAGRQMKSLEDAALKARAVGKTDEAELLLLDILELGATRVVALSALRDSQRAEER